MPASLLVAAAAITATVTGVPSSQGRVRVDVCTQPHWLKSGCEYWGEAPARKGTTVVTVRGVAPGRYGVQAYHDANGNGKADRNFLGMPTERVGFSNDAMKRLATPKYRDAEIVHGDAAQAITFRLRSVP